MTTNYLFLAEVPQAVSSHILRRHGGALQERRNDAGSAVPAVGGGLLLCQRAGRDRHGAVPRCESCLGLLAAGMQFNVGFTTQLWAFLQHRAHHVLTAEEFIPHMRPIAGKP